MIIVLWQFTFCKVLMIYRLRESGLQFHLYKYKIDSPKKQIKICDGTTN